MTLNLETLLAPIAGEDPAGPELPYDPARALIERAFERPVSSSAQTGDAPTSEGDWTQVIEAIESLSSRTKDIWLAIYLARAGVKSGRIATAMLGVEYLAGLLEQQWDSVHPKLAEYGFQGRKGACEALTTYADFIAPLRRAPLLEHARYGRFSGADFERFQAGGEAEDGYGAFRSAIGDTPEETMRAVIADLDRLDAALRAIDEVLTAKDEDGAGANFRPTYEALAAMSGAVKSFVGDAPAQSAEEPALTESANEPQPAQAAKPVVGRINSRDDVERTLDAIIDYYQREEPASPVPLTLQRVREWVSLDFLKLLEDIAPGSLDEARRVLVPQRKKDGAA